MLLAVVVLLLQGPFPIRLGKTMLTLLSFEWTSWGNGSASDLKASQKTTDTQAGRPADR